MTLYFWFVFVELLRLLMTTCPMILPNFEIDKFQKCGKSSRPFLSSRNTALGLPWQIRILKFHINLVLLSVASSDLNLFKNCDFIEKLQFNLKICLKILKLIWAIWVLKSEILFEIFESYLPRRWVCNKWLILLQVV